MELGPSARFIRPVESRYGGFLKDVIVSTADWAQQDGASPELVGALREAAAVDPDLSRSYMERQLADGRYLWGLVYQESAFDGPDTSIAAVVHAVGTPRVDGAHPVVTVDTWAIETLGTQRTADQNARLLVGMVMEKAEESRGFANAFLPVSNDTMIVPARPHAMIPAEGYPYGAMPTVHAILDIPGVSADLRRDFVVRALAQSNNS